jgi:hypothetical protein
MENAGDGGLLPQLRLDDLLAELQARLEAVPASPITLMSPSASSMSRTPRLTIS